VARETVKNATKLAVYSAVTTMVKSHHSPRITLPDGNFGWLPSPEI
jgi:hypothetical protein